MKYNQLTFLKDNSFIKKNKGFKPILPKSQRSKNVIAPIPPKDIKISKGFSWCPYCSMRIKLVRDKTLGIYRCPLCGISSKDFYMKYANKK